MIDVIGTDAGAPASLPDKQQRLIRSATLIAAPRRLQPALQSWLGSDSPPLICSDEPRSLAKTLENVDGDSSVVVLASGDPLWFGIGRILIDRLGCQRLQFHPSATAMQLAFARIGRPWQDAAWVSLHGREPDVLGRELQRRPAALAVLTDPNQGGAKTVQSILQSSGLLSSYQLWLCEQLGHPDERVLRIGAGEAVPENASPLLIAILIAEEPTPADPRTLPLFGLDDGLFLQQSDHPGLMTKREVRIQLLADLSLPTKGVLWDLGAGTGSVGLEALRLQPQLRLLAVEKRGGGGAVIQANAIRLGLKPDAVIEADALDLILEDQLPAAVARPDRVLLGGGGRQRSNLLSAVIERLQPGGVVVIPLATIEALGELRPLLDQAGLMVRISQLQAWRGQPLGGGTRLMPMNPCIILSGIKQ